MLECCAVLPFEDENLPLFTVGQVAQMLEVQQAFLRRLDEFGVVCPSRSSGGQRRYSRTEVTALQAERDALLAALAGRDELLSAMVGRDKRLAALIRRLRVDQGS